MFFFFWLMIWLSIGSINIFLQPNVSTEAKRISIYLNMVCLHTVLILSIRPTATHCKVACCCVVNLAENTANKFFQTVKNHSLHKDPMQRVSFSSVSWSRLYFSIQDILQNHNNTSLMPQNLQTDKGSMLFLSKCAAFVWIQAATVTTW